MTNENSEIELFLKEWSSEFSRSIEMFTGDKAVVSCTLVGAAELEAAGDLISHTWWKQVFERTGEFAYWIGAAESTWTALGGAVDGAGNEPQSAYLEIIGQASQAVAEIVTRRMSKPLIGSPWSIDALPPMSAMTAARISVTFREKNLFLIAALNPEAGKVLAAGNAALSVRPEAPQTYAPMLQRLMDLELPLSIGLGRAVLPVRDVLKMTNGSLIELDRNVGEYVDLVVHGAVVARGEVVSVKGNYGVRIKEIISRQDRLALQNGD